MLESKASMAAGPRTITSPLSKVALGRKILARFSNRFVSNRTLTMSISVLI